MSEREYPEIAADIENLLLEYHRSQNGDDNQVVTGIKYLITYEVELLDESDSGGAWYNMAGKQSPTLTIGLAHRGLAYVESEILYPDDRD